MSRLTPFLIVWLLLLISSFLTVCSASHNPTIERLNLIEYFSRVSPADFHPTTEMEEAAKSILEQNRANGRETLSSKSTFITACYTQHQQLNIFNGSLLVDDVLSFYYTVSAKCFELVYLTF